MSAEVILELILFYCECNFAGSGKFAWTVIFARVKFGPNAPPPIFTWSDQLWPHSLTISLQLVLLMVKSKEFTRSKVYCADYMATPLHCSVIKQFLWWVKNDISQFYIDVKHFRPGPVLNLNFLCYEEYSYLIWLRKIFIDFLFYTTRLSVILHSTISRYRRICRFMYLNDRCHFTILTGVIHQ